MQVAPDGWGRNTPVELLASARADVDALCAWLDSDFGPRLQRLLSFLPSEVLPPNLWPHRWFCPVYASEKTQGSCKTKHELLLS